MLAPANSCTVSVFVSNAPSLEVCTEPQCFAARDIDHDNFERPISTSRYYRDMVAAGTIGSTASGNAPIWASTTGSSAQLIKEIFPACNLEPVYTSSCALYESGVLDSVSWEGD